MSVADKSGNDILVCICISTEPSLASIDYTKKPALWYYNLGQSQNGFLSSV